MSWTAGVRVQAGAKFYLLHSVQTYCGAYPAFYPMGTGCDFTGGRAGWA
jgi:hypothetical protein